MKQLVQQATFLAGAERLDVLSAEAAKLGADLTEQRTGIHITLRAMADNAAFVHVELSALADLAEAKQREARGG